MNANDFADRLEGSGDAIAALLRGLPADKACWKPGAKRWSVLEVAHHLLDEESADFRTRVDHALYRPDQAFPPIDPEGWCVERRYNEKVLADVVRGFVAERRRSLEWLRHLGHADLARTHAAPWGGEIAAGDVLAAWVAHDLLHFRQILRVLYESLAADAAPFRLDYAGRGW